METIVFSDGRYSNYPSRTKEGPWSVHLTLDSERGVGQHL